jgi:hypothetical protein
MANPLTAAISTVKRKAVADERHRRMNAEGRYGCVLLLVLDAVTSLWA